MSSCNIECSTIEKQVQDTTTQQPTQLSIKDQLRTLSVDERYNLLNVINMEERVSFIKQQQQLAKEEESKITQCPLFKKVVSMNNEIQELKIDLQKLKNKSNEPTMSCPYSIFRFKDNQDYLSEADLCNELTETYTSSLSWWSTIMFIVFILFVLTSKPSKHCEQFFTTSM